MCYFGTTLNMLSALEDMLKNFKLIAIYFNIFSCVKMEQLQVSLV